MIPRRSNPLPIVALALAAGLWTAGAPLAQERAAPQLDAGNQATLDAFSSLMRQSAGVHKWQGAITLGFFDNPGPRLLAHARAFAAEVETLTGLSIAIVPPWDLPPGVGADPSGVDGHVVVMLPPDDDAFLDLTFDLGFEDDGETACVEVTETANAVAVSGLIAIPTNIPEREQQDCLSHEFMHVLGFQGHLDDEASILYPFVNDARFSDGDRALLRLLYHPSITSGMTADQAAAAARRILLDGQSGTPPQSSSSPSNSAVDR